MKLRLRIARNVSGLKLLACLVASSVVATAMPTEAGSIVIPAWAFDRGNVVIHADPTEYADAGPAVVGGPREPWGWSVEFDIDVPVEAAYSFQICYASPEARPVQVYIDDRNLTKCCECATLDPESSGQPDRFSGNSSAARWEGVKNRFCRLLTPELTKGLHTIKLTRRGPLPHLVALRADTPTPFPDDWKPAEYRVRDIESVPGAFRKSLTFPQGSRAVVLRHEIERMIRLYGPRFPEGPQHLNEVAALEKRPDDDALTLLHHKVNARWTDPPEEVKRGGSLVIPSWTFDRGNVTIFASPDQFADAGPLIGNDPQHTGPGWVEYDIDFPATGRYILKVLSVAGEARPTEVLLDGKSMGKVCYNITYGTAPHEIPVEFSWESSAKKDRKPEPLKQWDAPRKLSITQGKHTVRFARSGPLPHILEFQIESLDSDWRQHPRAIRHLDSVAARERNSLLPADSVNIAALRLAIEDRISTFGPDYPDGPEFLERLAVFEKEEHTAFAHPATRTWACEEGVPEEERTMEKKLAALRSDAMMAHPALKFDKLMFFKRVPFTGNTYTDNKMNAAGGSLCVLSPVSPQGKVTSLVPELDGGIFTRFDLSFDAKRVVFGYKGEDECFRLYEIDIEMLFSQFSHSNSNRYREYRESESYVKIR